jgi:CO/xanthine dehydrogenase Mo-binding subunit
MLHAAILNNPLAHSRILKINTTWAEKLPGIKAIIAHREAGTTRSGVSPARYDETIFRYDKVCSVGRVIIQRSSFG